MIIDLWMRATLSNEMYVAWQKTKAALNRREHAAFVLNKELNVTEGIYRWLSGGEALILSQPTIPWPENFRQGLQAVAGFCRETRVMLANYENKHNQLPDPTNVEQHRIRQAQEAEFEEACNEKITIAKGNVHDVFVAITGKIDDTLKENGLPPLLR